MLINRENNFEVSCGFEPGILGLEVECLNHSATELRGNSKKNWDVIWIGAF